MVEMPFCPVQTENVPAYELPHANTVVLVIMAVQTLHGSVSHMGPVILLYTHCFLMLGSYDR